MEAIVLKAVVQEVGRELPARVHAVLQPSPREIVLVLRAAVARQLLLSAAPEAPRLHYVAEKPPVIPAPTAFCRLLRKHLEGKVLVGAQCPGSERVVRLVFARPSGPRRELVLVAEIMGKHSNIILVDDAAGRVIDSLQHVAPPLSRVRSVLPGVPYTAPPVSGKLDLAALDAATFAGIYRETGGRPEALFRRVLGLGPGFLALGVACAQRDPGYAADPGAAVFAALMRCREIVEGGACCPAIYPHRKLLLPLVVPGWEPPSDRTAATMNQAAEDYYRDLLSQRVSERLRAEVRSGLERERRRLEAEEALRRAEISKGSDADLFQAAGTALLTAATVPRGAKAFRVEDAEGKGAREVALDPALGPRENAAALFGRAKKIRRRSELAREKLPGIAARRRRLDEEIALVPTLPVEALQARAAARVVATARRRGRTAAPSPPGIREYRSVEGWRILVGKSGAGNDYLTGRIAAPEDYWFHARDYPGAHVVLKGAGAAEPPEAALTAAGEIAAWHSGARAAGMVEVAYARRKHLRKIKGGAPGKVWMTTAATLRVRPRIPAAYSEVKG